MEDQNNLKTYFLKERKKQENEGVVVYTSIFPQVEPLKSAVEKLKCTAKVLLTRISDLTVVFNKTDKTNELEVSLYVTFTEEAAEVKLDMCLVKFTSGDLGMLEKVMSDFLEEMKKECDLDWHDEEGDFWALYWEIVPEY